MPLLTFFYILSILVAFLSSLNSFRLDFPFHLRLFSCLLGLTFFVEVTATVMAFGMHQSNNWVYNGFTLLEFWAYGYFFRFLLPGRRLQRLMIAFMIIFPIFWVITVFYLFGFTAWNSYVIITGSFFSVLFCLLYYYRLLTTDEVKNLRTLPEFWIATGMLIFYMAALPYFGSLNFLIQYHIKAAQNLLMVLQGLDICMYLFFTYGFLCRIHNIKKS